MKTEKIRAALEWMKSQAVANPSLHPMADAALTELAALAHAGRDSSCRCAGEGTCEWCCARGHPDADAHARFAPLKPEKMTPDVLAESYEDLETEGYASMAQRFRAHIAAVEAERDEWQGNSERNAVLANDCAMKIGALIREGDALRERVKALEADRDRALAEVLDLKSLVRTWQEQANKAMDRADSVESRLSAIRQRAGQVIAQNRDAENEVRYIVGEYGAGAETPAPYCDEHGASNGECATSHPEPTTAEAFATVRTLVTGVPRGAEVSSVEGERLLSLLERRMGAMARELGLVASDLYHERFATAESRVKDLIALTDAPPGFTLEEVETVVRGALTDSGEWAPVVGIVMSAIRERLHALRR
jgi:hypothetical protein